MKAATQERTNTTNEEREAAQAERNDAVRRAIAARRERRQPMAHKALAIEAIGFVEIDAGGTNYFNLMPSGMAKRALDDFVDEVQRQLAARKSRQSEEEKAK
jgi:hypothetical protein